MLMAILVVEKHLWCIYHATYLTKIGTMNSMNVGEKSQMLKESRWQGQHDQNSFVLVLLHIKHPNNKSKLKKCLF